MAVQEKVKPKSGTAKKSVPQVRNDELKQALERHKLKKKADKLIKEADEKARLRPKHKPKKFKASRELRAKQNANWAHAQALAAAKERKRLGLPPIKVTVQTPERLMLALQVQSTERPGWGTIMAIEINPYTSDARIREHTEQLTNLKYGWISSNYYINPQFRIVKVKVPKHVGTY
ncbi:MAG: hypothetical protein MN733_10075 [Nitrososphaera sp.]|nr:hypothetical protein [Nitrososphaera sp.]